MLSSLITYIYIIIIVVFFIGAIWIWTKLQPYVYPSSSESSSQSSSQSSLSSFGKDTRNLRQIYSFVDKYTFYLRTYLEESLHSLPYNRETLRLLKEECTKYLDGWKDIMELEHHVSYSSLQSKRWRLHIELVDLCVEDEDDETDEDKEDDNNKKFRKILRDLRHINRNISELHEDWWGLNIDTDEYLRLLNYFDQTLKDICEVYVDEESGSVQLKKYKELQSIHKQQQEMLYF